MRKSVTKKDVENFLGFWEYSSSKEIKRFLNVVDDFYSTPDCVATIKKIDNLNGLPVTGIKVNMYGTISSNALNYLKETYKSQNVILELIDYCCLDDGVELSDFGFVEQKFVLCGHKCSLNNAQYFSNKPKDYLQNIYLESIAWGELAHLNNVVIKKMDKYEVLEYVYDKHQGVTKYLKDLSHSNFAGFHYFGDMIFESHIFEHYYIVALYNDAIVGIISVKAYDKSKNYDGSLLLKFISYIDVREDCKRMGLANKMIAYLNEVEPDFILGTDMSEEGKLADIHSVFARHLQSKWYSSYEQYFYAHKEKDLR